MVQSKRSFFSPDFTATANPWTISGARVEVISVVGVSILAVGDAGARVLAGVSGGTGLEVGLKVREIHPPTPMATIRARGKKGRLVTLPSSAQEKMKPGIQQHLRALMAALH